jgi:hypothetical protein
LLNSVLEDNNLIQAAPRNRYITILRLFLKHWLQIKVTDRTKKEVQVLGQWLKENDTKFGIITPNMTNEMKYLQA